MDMKRHKTLYSPTGSNIPRGEAKVIPGILSKQQERALVDAEVRAEIEAPLRAVDAKRDEALQEIADHKAEFKACWLKPLNEITEQMAVVDLLTAYTSYPEGTLPPMTLEFRERWDEMWNEFM